MGVCYLIVPIAMPEGVRIVVNQVFDMLTFLPVACITAQLVSIRYQFTSLTTKRFRVNLVGLIP